MKNGPVYKAGPGEEFPDHTPKQYLQGWVEFYKLKFKVSPVALIPRPETELLVDEVLQFILRPSKAHGEIPDGSRLRSNNNWLVLDVGTGCGNIAISIAKNALNAKIFATDISSEALELAKQNARSNRMDKRIFFMKSDLLETIKAGTQVDVIVTNLPYIPSSRINYLDPSVRDFEPRLALDGGPEGFGLYRKLFQQMVEKNLIPKLFIGEIDYTHGDLAIQEVNKFFPKAKVEVKTDLAQKQRILIIKF